MLPSDTWRYLAIVIGAWPWVYSWSYTRRCASSTLWLFHVFHRVFHRLFCYNVCCFLLESMCFEKALESSRFRILYFILSTLALLSGIICLIVASQIRCEHEQPYVEDRNEAYKVRFASICLLRFLWVEWLVFSLLFMKVERGTAL